MTLSVHHKWTDYSFRAQLFLVLTLLTALVTVILTLFLISFERASFRKQLLVEGEILVSFLAKELQLPLYAGHAEEVAQATTAMMNYANITAIRVRDADGRLIADVRRFPTVWESAPLSVAETVTTTPSDFSPEAQLLGVAPSGKETIGSIEIALDTHSIAGQLQHFVKEASVIAVTFWIAVSAIVFLILRQMTRTLTLLLDGIGRIAAGDLESRIVIMDSSNTAQAAATINNLAETLRQREQENKELQLEIINGLRLEIDEEKARHMAKLIQTNRMTSLGLLVSSMAHEINNPNGAIRLAGEYLVRAWKDAEPLLAETAHEVGEFSLGNLGFNQARQEIDAALDTIARSSDRIERVVHNLRSYSLGDRDELRTDVDLNRVANAALAIVRAHSKQADVNIGTQLDPALPHICGNPFQLEQVVTNLLLNAMQALPPKGSRRIFLSTAWQRHDNSVVMEVRDEGHGIPKEHLEHLCEPFFSTRINMGGSGLGLYITHFIVSEHHGQLSFRSKPGTGTTVIVQLPVTPPIDSPPAQPPPASG